MSAADWLFAALARHARHADRVAIVAGEETVTYARLLDDAERMARQLAAAGAFDGRDGGAPRIGLACPNGVAHVTLALAVLRGGGCLVPIAGELSPRERAALARAVDLDAAIVAGGARTPGLAAAGRTSDLAEVAGTLVSEPLGRDRPPAAFDARALAALSPALVRFSSGTTGDSKGVVLSHATLAARIAAANRGLAIGPSDSILWLLPMAHHFAVSVLLYLAHGAAMVLVPAWASGRELAATARRHGVTVLYAAPFHHALLAGDAAVRPWDELRLAVSTTAPLSAATASAFAARLGRPLSQALGIIEAGLPAINLARAADKPESVGRPLADYAIELRDEAGAPAAPGAIGELLVRGPGLLDAYLSPWRSRAEILRDGWFATGDLATRDADGDLRLVGRARTAINVAGMKCFPEEIEAVLREHGGVRDARVSGRAHARVGAVPVADVVPADPARPPDAAALAAHCRASLARYKVPVEFRIVDVLPTTASGKLRRWEGEADARGRHTR